MTFQVRERLVYRGQVHQIDCLPLASYRGPAQVPDFGVQSAACWRGYQGVWEVREDALYLVQVDPPERITGRDPIQDALHEMFPQYPGPVPATWFSGELAPESWREPGEAFALVFHAGQLVLEEALDGEGYVRLARLTAQAQPLVAPGEWGFLETIQANRTDLSARLVYADWLEEHNESRAQLVRQEVARLQEIGPARRIVGPYSRQDIPGGLVDPDDRLWFWRRLADIRMG